MFLGHLRGEHESKVKVSISRRTCVYHQIHSTSSDSIQHTGLGSLGGLSEKCGQNLKYVGRSLCVQWILVISLQQLFCPTFLRFWPHISESDPPWKKTAHMGLKNYGMVPKKILWPRHMYKWYILKKNWQKSVNSTLSTGEKKVPVGIWGCHHQLDNHHK